MLTILKILGAIVAISHKEMKEIMVGSHPPGGGGSCSGNWTIDPAYS